MRTPEATATRPCRATRDLTAAAASMQSECFFSSPLLEIQHG
ncbi:hypothetical protein GWL_23190 [Herbaspirillum sp. GW103]|nr:hypothetical protein GWL_23190 [Herbaspirillum sp. GW103]